MQDILVPIFGESGANIAQLVITLGVVIALIVLVVWGIRHFGGGAVHPAARGRLPRLAIVDTLPVDTKRKLILLRRDNVEHLILVGGPSDIVVEPSIVRQRVSQRAGQGTALRAPASTQAEAHAPAAAGESFESYMPAPQPAPVEPPAPARMAAPPEAGDSAIPFVPRRGSPTAGERSEYRSPAERPPSERAERHAPPRRETLRGTMQATPAPAPEAPRPYRTFTPATTVPSRTLAATSEPDPEAAPAVATRPTAPPPRAESPASRFAPPVVRAVTDDPPDGPVPGYEAPGVANHDAVNAFAPPDQDDDDGDAPEPRGEDEIDTVLEEPAATDSAGPDDETVGELEQEMARLLNQISTSRRE